VSGYIHVPTVFPVGKAAVYNTRESVPQVQSADEKEESHLFPLAHRQPLHLKLELPPQLITCCPIRLKAEIQCLLSNESERVY
jgi:hypothetical protein